MGRLYVRRVARKVDVTDLVGTAEIAKRLGYRRAVYVHNLRTRHSDFPAPVAELSSGLVWAWADVEAWARKTGRLK